MPAVGHHILKIEGVLFGWQELTGWLFFAGLFMILAARNYQKRNAVAINDPLIYEATEYYS